MLRTDFGCSGQESVQALGSHTSNSEEDQADQADKADQTDEVSFCVCVFYTLYYYIDTNIGFSNSFGRWTL